MPDGHLLRWESRFATGDEAVDFDHQVLFALVNELHAAVIEGCGSNTVRDALAELNRYAKRHFCTEESLMEACGYPGLKQHHDAHMRMCEEIDRLRREESDRPLQDLCVLVYDWLTQHILGEDLPMMTYVQRLREARSHGRTRDGARTARFAYPGLK